MFKMKKKTLTILAIFLIPVALAITLGQIFTQEQLDNADIDNINLECTYHNFTVEMDGEPLIKFLYSCFALKDLNNGTYEVIRIYQVAGYPVESFIDCRNEHNKTWCLKNEIKPTVIQEVKEQINRIKDEAKSFQTILETNLSQEDINLTDEDFN